MSGLADDRSGALDQLAQLRRRWAVVAGGGLVGLVVGVGILKPLVPMEGALALRIAVAAVPVAAGLLVGLIAGLALVRLHPRITTVDDVRRTTGLPVLAQLPSAIVDADDYDDGRAATRMRSAFREAVLNLSALSGGELPGRIVLARTTVLSDASGVDSGIARALVEGGSVPVLVESDFEGRMLARPATIDGLPFAQTSRADPAGAASAGYERVAVSDLVASARPRERLDLVDALLDGLLERYDVSVAQASCESLPVPLRSIAPVADAVVLVVRSNRTTVEDVVSLQAELLSLDVEPIGVIVTGVASRHRVQLRRTWSPTDFRPRTGSRFGSGRARAALPTPKLAGFSIADLVNRAEALGGGVADGAVSAPALDSRPEAVHTPAHVLRRDRKDRR